jgi:hypothetical protein
MYIMGVSETEEMRVLNLGAAGRADLAEKFRLWTRKLAPELCFAVYGAGADWRLISEAAPDFARRVSAVLDDSGAPGTLKPAPAALKKFNIIVVCSLLHQEAIKSRLEGAGFDGLALTLYKTDPEIGTLGFFACHQEEDFPFAGEPSPRTEPDFSKKPRKIRKILLIQPPFSTANSRHKKTMPLGLLYTASAIRKAFPKIELELFDAHILRRSWDETRKFIDSQNFDAAMIGYWSAQFDTARLISDYIRASKSAWVIHGGVHATLCPEDALRHADLVVRHEGELAAVDIISAVGAAAVSLDKRVFCSDFIEDLDSLDFPAWDLMPKPELYDHPMHVVGGRRFPVVGSRGCPFNCSFCSSPLFWKRKVRWRSPGNVVSEMDAINQKFGVDKFHFWDDNFVMNRKYASGLAEELLKRERAYQWCGLSRASDIVKNADILPLLRDAGCVGIEIGVESFADQVSRNLDKGEDVESTLKAAGAMKAAGLTPLYTHMLFTPGEDIASHRPKELFLARINEGSPGGARSDSALGQLCTPHVKTTFAADAAKSGMVLWRGPRDSFHHRVNFIPDSFLDDIPAKGSAAAPDPKALLTLAVQAIIDWTEDDMRLFIRASRMLWEKTDGVKTLRVIISAIASETTAPAEKAAAMTAVAAALLAKSGDIIPAVK